MPTCEHFIYTTAKTNLKTGYQIIAKSSGINDRLLSSLTNYLYPLGVNPNEFTESKSLLPLGKEHMAYSIVKNIGVGYDGRNGTLYNHTMIMKKNNFEKLDNDTRILDKYFIEDYSIRGELDTLYIQPEKIEIDFDYLKKLERNLLSTLLFYLFKKSKIAIVKVIDENLIQNLLSVIPPQIRFMPFSTMVLEPSRQSRYQLIQIPTKVQPKLQANYTTINPDALPTSKIKQAKDIGIESIIELIYESDQKQLFSLHRDFDKITSQVSKIKRIKVKDIFDKDEFIELAENRNFSSFRKNVKNLYANPTFNEASPRTMITITKKISRIVKKSLRSYENNELTSNDIENIISISKILLDSLHYINQYSEKKMVDSTQIEIENEIQKLESILQKYPETASITENYEFNVYEYFKTLFADTLHSMYSMSLYVMGRRWW